MSSSSEPTPADIARVDASLSAAAPAAPASRVVLGIVLAFSAFAIFAFSDASVKMIEGRIPPYESAFFGAVFSLVALPFLMRPNDRMSDIFRTQDRRMWFIRFIAYPLGVMGSVTAFTHLTMAEAFALIFLQPAFVTLMSVLFLKEAVGLKRWSAVLLGFIGVLIVLRPGFRELSIGHFGALMAGLGGAIAIITFRAAPKGEKKISLFGAGIVGAIVLCGLAMLPGFRMPVGEEWVLLALYGLFAAFANVLLMYAAFHAPAAAIAPIQYSQMLWGLVLGRFLFGDVVDLPMLVGIVLIVGSGLLTLGGASGASAGHLRLHLPRRLAGRFARRRAVG
ncbi:MAG: DMT family transporter [Xanthobacter sp.]